MTILAEPAPVGILMLESRFPRILGDIGNAGTWPFPVIYSVVKGASPDAVVVQGAPGLAGAFIDAARSLVDEGACGITTSCGFLAPLQSEIAAAVSVPVATSSLMQVAMINQLLPRTRLCGVLTIKASSLTDQHLQAASVPLGTPVGSTEGGREFTRAIIGDEADLDIALARQDNVEAAMALKQAHPNLGALVLECTNMSPYAADIANAIELPVYSIETFIRWFQSGLEPRSFDC